MMWWTLFVLAVASASFTLGYFTCALMTVAKRSDDAPREIEGPWSI